ncbi:MAG: class I SAM-dependent methyltransferase [Clostridia bacterium]|nr:class I SAM-dependent methyltransferase [Clostridia bacterium]
MTEGYEVIAQVYDRLNADIDYKKWADFAEQIFERYLKERPEIVLDLACGTGSMTAELALRGYDMIGVDGSEQMLSVATERAYVNFGEEDEYRLPILYLLQDMRSFELYGTVGAVLCCLDSINYLVEDGDLEKCFATVHNYLDPDGVFIFDVNTPYKFKNVYGDNAYILEEEIDEAAVYCGWQNSYNEKSCLCDFYLTLFSENEDGSYTRAEEHQRERKYELCEIKNTLQKCGFEWLGAFSDYNFKEAGQNDERWYIIARAKK